MASEAIKLRDYQEECINVILENLEKGTRRMAVSLATGSGKTIIFTQLISRLKHPVLPDADQTLILVHRRELVQQAAKHCQTMYPDMVVEIEMGTSHASGRADITVASIQSIVNRLEKFNPECFKLILIDECHHAVSSTYLKCLDHFGALEVTNNTPVVVGVSATVSRFDGLSLGKVMDRIVYHLDATSMIEKDWLAPPCFTTVRSSVDLSGVRSTAAGDYQLSDLSRAVNRETANEILVKTWIDRAGERKSTLVFCVDLDHVQAVVNKFREYGIDAQSVTSFTPLQVRRERLESFKEGGFKVLVNCGVFTEGTDIPVIDCVILARPTRSVNLITQMIGRGLRKSESSGKMDCHIIDMVASVLKGIVTTPTLFGLDPDEVIDRMTPEEMRAKAEERRLKEEERRRNEEERVRKIEAKARKLEEERTRWESDPGGHITLEYTDYDDIWDLLSDSRSSTWIAELSHLCWIAIDGEKYILSCGRNGTLKIEKDGGKFTVTETRSIPKSATVSGKKHVRSRPRAIMEDIDSLELAIHGADTYALSKYPRPLLLRDAGWRRAPPSTGQLEFLKKIKTNAQVPFEEWVENEGLTKGKAMDMITRFRYGAVAKWDGLKKAKEREEREREKLVKLRKREQVSVGAIE